MDPVDRELLFRLQEDATTSYAALGQAVGLSAAAAHERVRKLRERGVLRRTTVDVDPVALGRGVLAFVTVEANAWVGGQDTADALRALPWVEEAHVVAGGPSLLLKVRAESAPELQRVLRHVFDVDGVSGTTTIVVLETFFERRTDPRTAHA